MIKILFVCHGNICRSPMAEFVLKGMVAQAGMAQDFEIASAATSTEEIGHGVYPPVKKLLLTHGLDPQGKQARQMTKADYAHYDLLIGMDSANLRNMLRICGGSDPDDKIIPLLAEGDIADPWYTNRFEQTWQEVNEGCRRLLDILMQRSPL